MTSITSMIDRTAQAGRELVAFRIGQQEFAIDVGAVREIRGWTAETILPSAPAFVRGLVNLRGTVLPILDLGGRLGLPPAEPTSRHVIMIVQAGQQMLGVLVDAVSDIQTIEEARLQPLPEVGAELARQFVQGILAVEDRMIVVLALDEVLPAGASELIAA